LTVVRVATYAFEDGWTMIGGDNEDDNDDLTPKETVNKRN